MVRKRGRPTRAETENTPPTDETVKKLAPNPLLELSVDLQEAAASIDRAYHRLCARLMSRASNMERTVLGKEAEPNRSDLILILMYQEWIRRAFKMKMPTEQLIDMIVEGHNPTDVDRRCHWAPGSARTHLTASLNLYLKTAVPLDARGRNLEQRLAQTGDHLAA